MNIPICLFPMSLSKNWSMPSMICGIDLLEKASKSPKPGGLTRALGTCPSFSWTSSCHCSSEDMAKLINSPAQCKALPSVTATDGEGRPVPIEASKSMKVSSYSFLPSCISVATFTPKDAGQLALMPPSTKVRRNLKFHCTPIRVFWFGARQHLHGIEKGWGGGRRPCSLPKMHFNSCGPVWQSPALWKIAYDFCLFFLDIEGSAKRIGGGGRLVTRQMAITEQALQWLVKRLRRAYRLSQDAPQSGCERVHI